MADGFDRHDNDNNSGGSFVMGLLTGTVLGAGLGILFAPKVGSDLRNQMREQAGNLANSASDGYRRAAETAGEYAGRAAETASQYAERGRDMAGDLAGRAREVRDMAGDLAGRAREAVVKGAEEAQRHVRDASGSTDVGERMGTASGSGGSGPTPMGSSPTGPRPAGSYPSGTSIGSSHSSDIKPHPGGGPSSSGGFGGPRG